MCWHRAPGGPTVPAQHHAPACQCWLRSLRRPHTHIASTGECIAGRCRRWEGILGMEEGISGQGESRTGGGSGPEGGRIFSNCTRCILTPISRPQCLTEVCSGLFELAQINIAPCAGWLLYGLGGKYPPTPKWPPAFSYPTRDMQPGCTDTG